MKKYKYNEIDGYGIYTTEFQKFTEDSRLTKIGHKLSENSIEILMVALFAGMIAGVGMLLHTTAVAADTLIQYVEIEERDYEKEKVMEALIEQRMEAVAEVSAEQPPYWTPPAETK